MQVSSMPAPSWLALNATGLQLLLIVIGLGFVVYLVAAPKRGPRENAITAAGILFPLIGILALSPFRGVKDGYAAVAAALKADPKRPVAMSEPYPLVSYSRLGSLVTLSVADRDRVERVPLYIGLPQNVEYAAVGSGRYRFPVEVTVQAGAEKRLQYMYYETENGDVAFGYRITLPKDEADALAAHIRRKQHAPAH